MKAIDSLACWQVLPQGGAVTPDADEFRLRNEWLNPLLGRTQQIIKPHLELLFEDAPAEGVSRGRSWRGTPFQIGDKTYTNGLAFNSTSTFLWSSAGRRFAARWD
jgi:hypothetical protein